jgi:hypothetical protein
MGTQRLRTSLSALREACKASKNILFLARRNKKG